MTNTLPGLTGRFVEPDKIVTHLHLRPGDKVADFGAGSGYFTKALAQIVGPSGRVYACEIQKSLLDTIAALAQKSGLNNVEVLWSDVEAPHGTKIDDGVLDAGLVSNTLFQFGDKVAAITEIMRTLRSGGKFFVIDWSESFGGLGPQPGDVITESDARALLETGGFVFERKFDAGDHHYGLAFRKP